MLDINGDCVSVVCSLDVGMEWESNTFMDWMTLSMKIFGFFADIFPYTGS